MAKKNRRIQVELTAGAFEELEKLREELGESSMSGVIRSSLRTMRFLHEEKKDKDIILRNKSSGSEERLIL